MTPEQTFSALQRVARQSGRAVDEVLTLYVLERFLERLVESRFADSFVLKGGVLLAGYGLRRPTRDVDMQAIDFVLDEEHCKQVVAAVAAVEVDDGLEFEAEPTRVEQIRDGEEYSGLRVHVGARLYRSRIAPKLDISTGDPISPNAQRVMMPRILGGEFAVLGHPPETIVAEKAVTILQRGATSTRWRDYMDLRSLAHSRTFTETALRTAIDRVAQHRNVELSAPSASVAAHDDLAQQKWAAWRKKTDVEDITMAALGDQLADVCAFLDPVFGDSSRPGRAWSPLTRSWS